MDNCACEEHGCPNKPAISGKGYCRRHYDEIREYGRTTGKKKMGDPHEIIIDGNSARFIYTDNKGNDVGSFIVDVAEVERVRRYKWSDNGNGYIRASIRNKTIYLHRMIAGAADGMDVDHINHNKADNTKGNLRVCEHYINTHNRIRESSNAAYKKKCRVNPYYATLTVNGVRIGLGYYKTKEEAHLIAQNKKRELGLVLNNGRNTHMG